MSRALPFGFLGLCALLAGCGRKPPARDYMKENVERWKNDLDRWGGSWAAWEERVAPFHDDVRAALAARPRKIAGIVGLDGFLFFRRSLEVLVSGELRAQKDDRDPYPATVDFARQLRAKGVDLLFCPIPVKAAIFPEKMSNRAPPPGGPYVNPRTRKLMLELAEAGVECVDLLPAFLEARDEARGEGAEPFYMKLDTHWSHHSLRLAARVISARIRGYPWHREVIRGKVRYAVKRATYKRRGDIVRMLPEAERVSHPPMKLEAEQVIGPDGSVYEDDESSPIVLLGDSYAAVFHFGDFRHGGLSAHIAKEIGQPVDLILGLGMGPKIRGKLARRGKGALEGKRLVIWAFSERDLYGYRSPWVIIPMP